MGNKTILLVFAALFVASIILAGCSSKPAQQADLQPVTIGPTVSLKEVELGRACPDAGRPIKDPIVFNQGADLATISPDGKQITQLTTLPSTSRAYAPMWSPDGQTLAYGFFFTSPDPTIAWLQIGMICGMDRRTGQGRILARSPEPTTSLDEATWTPDGQALILTHMQHIFNERKEFVRSDISLARYDLKTNSMQTLVRDAIRPALSPDGQQLAFIRLDLMSPTADRILMVAQSNGQQERALLNPQAGFYQTDSPRWAPDGQRLVFAASGGPATGLARPRPALAWWEQLLGMGVAEAHGDPANLWHIKADGQGLQQLTAAAVDDPHGAWSPDGQKIVYVTTLGAVTMLDVRGRTAKSMTEPGFAGLMDWNWR